MYVSVNSCCHHWQTSLQVLESVVGRLYCQRALWQRDPQRVTKFLLLTARDQFRKRMNDQGGMVRVYCSTGDIISKGTAFFVNWLQNQVFLCQSYNSCIWLTDQEIYKPCYITVKPLVSGHPWDGAYGVWVSTYSCTIFFVNWLQNQVFLCQSYNSCIWLTDQEIYKPCYITVKPLVSGHPWDGAYGVWVSTYSCTIFFVNWLQNQVFLCQSYNSCIWLTDQEIYKPCYITVKPLVSGHPWDGAYGVWVSTYSCMIFFVNWLQNQVFLCQSYNSCIWLTDQEIYKPCYITVKPLVSGHPWDGAYGVWVSTYSCTICVRLQKVIDAEF